MACGDGKMFVPLACWPCSPVLWGVEEDVAYLLLDLHNVSGQRVCGAYLWSGFGGLEEEVWQFFKYLFGFCNLWRTRNDSECFPCFSILEMFEDGGGVVGVASVGMALFSSVGCCGRWRRFLEECVPMPSIDLGDASADGACMGHVAL